MEKQSNDLAPAPHESASGGVSQNPPKAESIEKAIAESKAKLATAPLEKRGRGRPRKDAPGASGAMRNQLSELGGTNQPAVAQGAVSHSAAITIPSAVLIPALQFPYSIAARRTGFEGLKLTDEEAQEIAPQLDKVLQQYMPQLESRHAALISLTGSLAIVTAMKYMAYLDWKQEQAARPESHAVTAQGKTAHVQLPQAPAPGTDIPTIKLA